MIEQLWQNLLASDDLEEPLVGPDDVDDVVALMVESRIDPQKFAPVRPPLLLRGNSYALEFDGTDDYVDCWAGSTLNIREEISLLAWVRATVMAKAGEVGVLGKGIRSYGITQTSLSRFRGRRRMNLVWTYITGGRNQAKAALPFDSWHHIASTYDGKVLRLYIDGKPAAAKRLNGLYIDAKTKVVAATRLKRKIASGGHFLIGTRPPYARAKEKTFFRGRIREVMVFNRALSGAEVAEHAK